MTDYIKALTRDEFLKVIDIDGAIGNLTLMTSVRVDIRDNKMSVCYVVRSFNSAHSIIGKVFSTYNEALEYYEEVLNKYGTLEKSLNKLNKGKK